MEIWNYQVVRKLFFFYRHVCYNDSFYTNTKPNLSNIVIFIFIEQNGS